MGIGRSGLVDHDEVVNAREKIVRPQQLFRSISKLYGDLPQGAPDGKQRRSDKNTIWVAKTNRVIILFDIRCMKAR